MFATTAFEIDNPGPPIAGVTIAGASLRDAAGVPVASMLRLVHFVDLTAEPEPDPTWGSFAVFLNPEGTPFSGALPSGRTRLRIRYSIEARFTDAALCRVEIGGIGAAPVIIEGRVDGVWPTS